jgi:hypothetical protein
MEYSLALLESSLAANSVTKTLSPQEVERIEQHVSCLKSYLLTSQPQSDCPPTVHYFSGGRSKK